MLPPPVLPAPEGVDRCVAAFAYDGVGREVVARLKYRNARASVPFLAAAVAALVDPGAVDVVTWAPTAPARRRRRGFDQAEVLARAVARAIGVPCRRLLRRRPGAPAQTGRRLAERRLGPAFDTRGPGTVPGLRGMTGMPARVLVVDDVVTSGATATAAAVALRAAGATSVSVAAAARTPRGGSHRGRPADVHSAQEVAGHRWRRPPHARTGPRRGGCPG